MLFEKKYDPNDLIIYDIFYCPQFNFSFFLTNK